jgi:hypothetical protein
VSARLDEVTRGEPKTKTAQFLDLLCLVTTELDPVVRLSPRGF